MPRTGVEPAREYKSHYHLKVACLPIPPPRLILRQFYQTKGSNSIKKAILLHCKNIYFDAKCINTHIKLQKQK